MVRAWKQAPRKWLLGAERSIPGSTQFKKQFPFLPKFLEVYSVTPLFMAEGLHRLRGSGNSRGDIVWTVFSQCTLSIRNCRAMLPALHKSVKSQTRPEKELIFPNMGISGLKFPWRGLGDSETMLKIQKTLIHLIIDSFNECLSRACYYYV